MARGLILSLQIESKTFSKPTFLSIPRIPLPICKFPFVSPPRLRLFRHSAPPRCFCHYASSTQEAIDMTNYHEAFSRRMAIAGVKPHHRIALGVSGGPDSMALCVLTAHWKTNGLITTHDSEGFIDGLLTIIVDHSLRAESKEEANMVSSWVSKMGIRCKIAHCEWLDGRPKQGHLQEAARNMRYQQFQRICIENKVSVLLIAHHADDQDELFILRLSRNSGVLGLAGMPFSSQIFSSYIDSSDSKIFGILLVRPLLDFSKEDMYKICEGSDQNCVEDPTNQSLLYARNRIRASLKDNSSYRFKSELQAVISACRRTRLYVDYICFNLISKAVTVVDLGYAVIDLEILKQSKIEDLCLSRFIALLLQFISQRHRPIRGSASKLLLEYLHTFPCKTSLTAAGCYLCPAPGSKGTKVLVCCSITCPLPQTKELLNPESNVAEQHRTPNVIEQIIADSKLSLHRLVPDESEVHFLDITSESVLDEARRLNMLSETTYKDILTLQSEEVKHFRSKKEVPSEVESKNEVKSISMHSGPLRPGKICFFMNRFLVTLKFSEGIVGSAISKEANGDLNLGESWHSHCKSCVVDNDIGAKVRHMVEADWLYLADMVKCPNPEKFQQKMHFSTSKVEQATSTINLCSDYARHSAQRALWLLKSIPTSARRSLPVLVNSQGLLLSIPPNSSQEFPLEEVIVRSPSFLLPLQKTRYIRLYKGAEERNSFKSETSCLSNIFNYLPDEVHYTPSNQDYELSSNRPADQFLSLYNL